MKFYYGYNENYVDVTDKIAYFIQDNYLYIPSTDKDRKLIFGDVYINKIKNIKIIFDNNDILFININQAYQCELSQEKINYYKSICKCEYIIDMTPNIFVDKIHQKCILNKRYDDDTWEDEYPEQILCAAFIPKEAKVLELGSNIGRVSMIIATKLENSKNLVTLETDFDNYLVLEKNRIINSFNFNSVNAAISKRRLIQKDWNTYPSEIDVPGFTSVPIITFEEIENKYKIKFDTLMCDCEGALYYILMDFPNLLDNINLIIIENDFLDINQKIYIDEKFREKGFNIFFSMNGGFDHHPCRNNFFEVWKR
jgi:FkbM family methyltransferase